MPSWKFHSFMKIIIKTIAVIFVVATVTLAFIAMTPKTTKANDTATAVNDAPSRNFASGKIISPSKPGQSTVTPPFIVRDTESDSPGTNIVTRIVTFTAEIGGTPPPTLQWKVDKGSGFVTIPGATNSLYRIANAQVEHSGTYALFARNSAGEIRTTPQPLIVTEGQD
jgi:hypothetical protein